MPTREIVICHTSVTVTTYIYAIVFIPFQGADGNEVALEANVTTSIRNKCG
jgi:hypothetical protein